MVLLVIYLINILLIKKYLKEEELENRWMTIRDSSLIINDWNKPLLQDIKVVDWNNNQVCPKDYEPLLKVPHKGILAHCNCLSD